MILALSAAGLLIAAYVLYSQKSGKKMACMIGKNCDLVTTSPYAKTFGVDNSVMGVLFYSFLIAYSALALPVPAILPLALSVVASAFSIYLVYLQFFVIKELCDYCILSALVNWGLTAALLLSNPF